MITSIKINGKIPVQPGMKKVDDFYVTNWFEDFPDTSSAPFAGFYFGEYANNITYNSFDGGNPAVQYGELNNEPGYIHANTINYLDSKKKATLALTIGARILRPATPSGDLWFVADFSGSGAAGSGFAVGVGSNGRLRVAAQNTGASTAIIAEVDFPASISVGDIVAVTASIKDGSLIISVYDPTTNASISGASGLSGTRTVGTTNILIGRKPDNNFTTLSTDISAIVMLNGSLTSAEHLSVQRYLYSME
ncbi:hypothetical protein ACHQJB_12170 [Raoultella planticola]|uniref:hypothetical protein n=1 Tax=Raoultella planticola TaxID=575 RepID=UPI00388DC2A7